MKHEKRCGYQAGSGGGVIPAQVGAKVEGREDGEDTECDDLLDDLELNGREAGGADAVGGNLEQIFEKGNAPTDEDDLP